MLPFPGSCLRGDRVFRARRRSWSRRRPLLLAESIGVYLPMMKPKKPRRALPDAGLVFSHATRFMLAAERLQTKPEEMTDHHFVHAYAAPAIVLNSFASELFLKCLCLIDALSR